MKGIAELISDHPFFEDFDEGTLALLAGCARNVHLHPGEVLFREGEPADRFWVLRHGRIAIQIHKPAGGPIVIDTADENEVLGWSWMMPTPRWSADGVASLETSLVQFDAECLRGKCATDPQVGYLLMQRVSRVLADRLFAARSRLLDLYAGGTV